MTKPTISNWQIYDPDKLLSRTDDEILSMEFNGFICQEIIPREALFQAKNMKTRITINFGYYKPDTDRNGHWVIALINKAHNGEKTIEKLSHSSLSNALHCLKLQLD